MEIFHNQNGTTCIAADEGKGLRRKGEEGLSTMTMVALAVSDSPDNWEECEYGEPEPEDPVPSP